jgi:hypothetical protein
MTSHHEFEQDAYQTAALGIPSNVLARRQAAYDAQKAR